MAIKGITKTGFKFTISDRRVNDYRLLEALAAVDEGNSLAIAKALTLLLGEAQKNKLLDHVKEPYGTVTTDKIMAELEDVFKAKPVKNS